MIKHINWGKLGKHDYTRFQVNDKADLRYEETILEVVPFFLIIPLPFLYVSLSVRLRKLVLVGFEV